MCVCFVLYGFSIAAAAGDGDLSYVELGDAAILFLRFHLHWDESTR